MTHAPCSYYYPIYFCLSGMPAASCCYCYRRQRSNNSVLRLGKKGHGIVPWGARPVPQLLLVVFMKTFSMAHIA